MRSVGASRAAFVHTRRAWRWRCARLVERDQPSRYNSCAGRNREPRKPLTQLSGCAGRPCGRTRKKHLVREQRRTCMPPRIAAGGGPGRSLHRERVVSRFPEERLPVRPHPGTRVIRVWMIEAAKNSRSVRTTRPRVRPAPPPGIAFRRRSRSTAPPATSRSSIARSPAIPRIPQLDARYVELTRRTDPNDDEPSTAARKASMRLDAPTTIRVPRRLHRGSSAIVVNSFASSNAAVTAGEDPSGACSQPAIRSVIGSPAGAAAPTLGPPRARRSRPPRRPAARALERSSPHRLDASPHSRSTRSRDAAVGTRRRDPTRTANAARARDERSQQTLSATGFRRDADMRVAPRSSKARGRSQPATCQARLAKFRNGRVALSFPAAAGDSRIAAGVRGTPRPSPQHGTLNTFTQHALASARLCAGAQRRTARGAGTLAAGLQTKSASRAAHGRRRFAAVRAHASSRRRGTAPRLLDPLRDRRRKTLRTPRRLVEVAHERLVLQPRALHVNSSPSAQRVLAQRPSVELARKRLSHDVGPRIEPEAIARSVAPRRPISWYASTLRGMSCP